MSLVFNFMEDEGDVPGAFLHVHEHPHDVHVTISYNVKGDCAVVERRLKTVMLEDSSLKRIHSIGNLMYWQAKIKGSRDFDYQDDYVEYLQGVVTKKLESIFVFPDGQHIGHIEVFCMVANIRGFSVKVYM